MQLIEDGADILDIGGESTRPGALDVNPDEEIRRVVPVIEGIRKFNSDIPISIDTTKYEVAKQAVLAGAGIINDISGLNYDIRLAELAAERNLELIIMHIQGTPKTMQEEPKYHNVVEEVFQILQNKIQLAKSIGVKSIIADVGIGFGKTFEHNIELLKNLDKFLQLEVPLLLGISRKRFIGQMLNIEKPEDRDFPTVLIHTILLSYNINIIRVHNVSNILTLKKIFLALSKKKC
jgi:dihydropteroate synthase